MSRDLRFIAVSLLAWGFGEGMFFYFQALYLEEWGADPFTIGAALGALGVAMAISQAPAGYLADRIGPRPLMWASWLLGTAAAFGMAAASSLGMFVAAMLAYGLTSAVLAPMNSYITSARGQWSASRALSTTSASFHLGMVIGPLVGGVIGQQAGLVSVYWLAAGVLCVSTLLILPIRNRPVEIPTEKDSTGQGLLQNKAFLGYLGLMLITTLALYFAQPLTPMFLQDVRGLSVQQIGMTATFGSLGIVVLSLLMGRLSPSLGYLVGQPLVAVFALLMLRSVQIPWIAAGYFFAGGYRLTRTMALALARGVIQSNQTGLAFGLLETSNATAAIIAPVFSGWLYARSPNSIYHAALLLIAAAFVSNLILLPGLRKYTERPRPSTAQLTEVE